MYDNVMKRLTTVRSRDKANIEDQVVRIFALTKLYQRKEGVNLNPSNPIAREFLDRPIVRELKDGILIHGILIHYTSI